MNKESLKEFLSSKYQGWSSFLNNVIFPIFGEDDFEDGFETELLNSQQERKQLAEATGIRSIKQVGMMYVGVEPLQIFDVTVSNRVLMERNRVNIQRLIRAVMDQFSCAFMLFHYEDDTRWDWRFTYCRKNGNKEEATDSKRYTFLLGPGQSCRTATENFMTLYDKRASLEFKDIEEAFNVEALSKEFFGKYKAQYEAFVNYMVDPANGMRQDFIDTDFDHSGMAADKIRDREEKPIRDYVKKLLGRIVFLHFLQKKGWLGVPAGKDWGEGDRDFMLKLFKNATAQQKENFLDDILEGLFADGLDSNRSHREDLFDTHVEGFRNCRIPYLNGGLFERDVLDKKTSRFPAAYFDSLLTMLSQYNFTIDENDPNDAEVGVDPEMLGRIFENLLEDNKDKGAFYTPKEIVNYMCRESLIAYLQTDQSEENKERIRQFVTTHDAALLGDLKEDIDQKLIDVKICDPAIGSGAFPMGLLRELFFCRSAIEPNIVENAANIKRHIIQNNIYGVDIERGAVDIARLRFWLSLIVDEKSPEALPNLDFKIMQGNSLLESFHGIDLSNLLGTQAVNQVRIIFDDESCAQELLLKSLCDFYSCSDANQKNDLRTKIDTQLRDLLRTRITKPELQDEIDALGAQNDKFFLWHTWFHDVFSHGGFDIVIGNPPYIQLQNNGGELAKIYQAGGFETFARTGDIYCLFYELGWQLLKNGGHLCYITSNKWMRAGYGEKTREFFAKKTNPMLLIDFAGVKIFESATVDTNILLFAKGQNKHETVCAVTNKQNKDSVKNLSVFVQQQHSICDFAGSDSWVILSEIEQSIKRKIEAVGTPLKDWDIQINYGIKTGYNDAFIISTEKRNEILANCATDEERHRTAELIRPILRGRDIKRYGYEWANLWLIATFPALQYDINNYPAVKNHLLSFAKQQLIDAGYSWVADNYLAEYCKQKLSQTGEFIEIEGKRITVGNNQEKARKKTNNKWFETQDSISYWDDFSKPKIVWGNLNLRASFAMALDDSFVNAPSPMIVPASKYLLGMLNSKIADYYIRNLGVTRNGGYFEYKPMFVEQLPVPFTSKYSSLIEELVELKNEKRIDEVAYEIYGLTQEEIDYVESILN